MAPESTSKWQQFEEGVAALGRALDPDAVVQHDVHLPDRHTRRPRQRDVWIEARICKLFPVAVLVSCKRWKRKLHQGDLDAFAGELASSSAHKGVIYSYSGFTEPALEKAGELGICCCRLYQDEPPELPEHLWFEVYCCSQQVKIGLGDFRAEDWEQLKTYGDVLSLSVDDEGKKQVRDELQQAFRAAERQAVSDLRTRTEWPPDLFGAAIDVGSPTGDRGRPFRVELIAKWTWYRAKLEAYVLDGSYSFTGDEFIGRMATPFIDLWSPNPGSGWELLDAAPETRPSVFVFLTGGNLAKVFEQVGRRELPVEKRR